jgi:phosphoribosylamine--glycine ligase
VVLPLLTTDLLTIMQAVTEERLSEVPVEFDKGSACCVVAASGGYPQSYETGLPISGLTEGGLEGASVFHAGTRLTDQGLLTSGGRVLGVTAVDDCLEKAIENAYQKLKQIEFKGMHFRTDIGQRALKARGL